MPTPHTVHLDDISVTRVLEWAGPIKTVTEILPDTTADEWEASRPLLAPDFWDPGTNAYLCHVQTWAIRAAGRTILVDTGVGNDRDRPQVPAFAGLRTGFLDRLAEAGVAPEDVDVVINTHIHYDHVGWNTRLADETFVPTFPNATYLVPQADYDYFHPANAHKVRAPETEDERKRFDGIRLVFEDSIVPIEKAGQLRLWQRRHEIPGLPLTLEPAPGHTPGSSVVRLRAGNDAAVFVGDLVHSPMQFLNPGHRCSFDLDPARARASRREVLARAAADGAMIFPAHFPGHSAASIVPAGEGEAHEYQVASWAALPALTPQVP
jgi:glyoxylase-like metal-dependent hydrolase (beta-lactamase superfamily II)